MSTMDFSAVASTVLKPTTSEVSLFKEQLASARAVADSQQFIVYSLKKASNLRVLARPNNIQSTFKNHTTDVTACKFVNYSSNVIASASEGEFFVWLIKKEGEDTLTTQVYFSISEPVTIRNFSWFLDSKTRFPELLMVYDTKVLQFSSSALITKYTDKTLEATIAEYGLPFERSITATASLTSVGAEGLYAFSVDESSVVVCTARNSNAPAWKPCDGETLIALELLQDNQTSTLVAACESFVSVWRVGDKEPTRTRKILFGAPITQLSAAHNTVAVFTQGKQCFLVDLSGGAVGNPAKFETNFVVPRDQRALSFNMMSPVLYSFLADLGSQLSITQIPVPAVVAAPAPKAAAPAPTNATPALPPPRYAPSKQAAAPASAASPVTLPAPRQVQLTNPSLPQVAQDGQIAQTLDQCSHDVAELQQRLNSALDNVSQIVTLVPQMVRKDHVSLMALSLEAQMTELQASGSAIGGGNGSGVSNGFESHFVAELLDNVARGLVDGIVPGIREALLSELEPRLRTAVVQQLKKTQKDTFKTKVDALLRNVAQEFILELEKKQKAYEKTFEQFGKDVRRFSEASSQRMTQTIASLEDQLLVYTQSGILEELQALRAEVKKLREQASSTASNSTAAINPVTILATARGLFDREGPVEGLRYLTRVNHSEVTLQFLSDITDDETLRDAALEVRDTAVWVSILSQLLLATKFNQLKVALTWMDDVLSEQSDLAKDPVLKTSLKTFVQTWKEDAKTDVELSQKLRSIDKWTK